MPDLKSVTGKVESKCEDAGCESFVLETKVGYWVCELLRGEVDTGHTITGEFFASNLEGEEGVRADNKTTGEPLVVYLRFFGGRSVATINLTNAPAERADLRS